VSTKSKIISQNRGRRAPTWSFRENFAPVSTFFIFISACLIAENHVCPCLSDTGEIHDIKRLPALKNEEPSSVPTYI